MTPDEYNARAAREMSEAALLEHCRAIARALGLLAYHTHNSQRSEPGFPDLVVVGCRGVMFGRITEELTAIAGKTRTRVTV